MSLEKWKEIIRKQKELNDLTCGEGWDRLNITDEGKEINWALAANQEVSELYDSLNWKHWKDEPIDTINAQMEAVDILHFIISLGLELQINRRLSLDENIHTYISMYDFELMVSESYDYIQNLDDDKIEPLFTSLSKLRFYLSCYEIDKDGTINDSEHFINTLISLFMVIRELNFDVLWTYDLKNILNEFRQMNGYKEGTYIKVWNGVEDNKILIDAFGNRSNTSKEEVIEYLKNQYSFVLANQNQHKG